MEDLYEKKSISNQEFDEASAGSKRRRPTYDMAQARRQQLDCQARAGRSGSARRPRVTRSYADDLGALRREWSRPKPVEPGNLAMPGAPLLTIEREGAYRLEAPVEESHLSAIRVGQTVSVTLDSDRARDRGACLRDRARGGCRVARLHGEDRSAGARRSCARDVRARGVSRLGSRPLLAIPAAAVMERGQLQSVFVVENGIARTRLITVGQKRRATGSKFSPARSGRKGDLPGVRRISRTARGVEVRP